MLYLFLCPKMPGREKGWWNLTDPSTKTLGSLLRGWRQRRRMSQLDLACDAEISAKHLSFLETGRSRPSRQMLLHLAACLDIPLRARNILLGAAGFAPVFQERAFSEPELGMIRRNVDVFLTGLEPNPAMAMDRHWNLLTANRAMAYVLSGTESNLLRPIANVVRLMLHPAGLAPRIVNLGQWRNHIITRLRRQIDNSGDLVLMDLMEEVRDYPIMRTVPAETDEATIAIPFRLATIDGILSFYFTTTSFNTPIDITLAELAVETLMPADMETARIMQQAARRDDIHTGFGLIPDRPTRIPA